MRLQPKADLSQRVCDQKFPDSHPTGTQTHQPDMHLSASNLTPTSPASMAGATDRNTQGPA